VPLVMASRPFSSRSTQTSALPSSNAKRPSPTCRNYGKWT
jgi:hypothetical protein